MSPPRGQRLVALVGTTASGKSQIALEVARDLGDVEIVSVDSMAVYRGMDIATAKPRPAERQLVPHHVIDVVEPSDEFTVADFKRLACRALEEIAARRRRPLLVGGTGLYLRAIVDDLQFPGRWPGIAAELEAIADRCGGVTHLYARLAALDPLAASRITPTNRRRIVRALEVTIGSGRPFSSFGPGLGQYPATDCIMIGLPFEPAIVDRRIEERFRTWLQNGLLAEVQALARRREGISRTARQALGYRELLAHVEMDIPLEAAVEVAVRRTKIYARRQWAWFKRDPRIHWALPPEDPAALLRSALEQVEHSQPLRS